MCQHLLYFAVNNFTTCFDCYLGHLQVYMTWILGVSYWIASLMKTKLRDFSPQVNTDQATAACRWSSCQLLWIEGLVWSAQQIPMDVNLDFLNSEPQLFHSGSSLVILTRLSGPCSRPTTSKKNLVAQGIEPRTAGFVVRNSDH
jgi:hypothetical protein